MVFVFSTDFLSRVSNVMLFISTSTGERTSPNYSSYKIKICDLSIIEANSKHTNNIPLHFD